MADYTQNTLYQQWREASTETTAYWLSNQGDWTDGVDATYRALEARSEALYYEYLSAKTGKTPHEVACSINERIHSPRD
jgi:hypothetical protein